MIGQNVAPLISRITLLTGIRDGIAAVCHGAIYSAAIGPGVIVTNCIPYRIRTGALIAFLARLEDTIAANKRNFDRALGTATVIVIILCKAVATRYRTGESFLRGSTNRAVAGSANAETAFIALLSRIDDGVSAVYEFQLTDHGATIPGNHVSIIALLCSFAGTVAADCFQDTGRTAPIARCCVSIITLLRSFRYAVPACCFASANIAATITGSGVSIITFLSHFPCSVTAHCCSKAGTGIVTDSFTLAVSYTIIAELTNFPEAIPAEVAAREVWSDWEIRRIEGEEECSFFPHCLLSTHEEDLDRMSSRGEEDASLANDRCSLDTTCGIHNHIIDQDPCIISGAPCVCVESICGDCYGTEPFGAVMRRITRILIHTTHERGGMRNRRINREHFFQIRW